MPIASPELPVRRASCPVVASASASTEADPAARAASRARLAQSLASS